MVLRLLACAVGERDRLRGIAVLERSLGAADLVVGSAGPPRQRATPIVSIPSPFQSPARGVSAGSP